MMRIPGLPLAALAAALLAGCAGYRWTSDVPEELRTVAVPVFENRTDAAEIGPVATQYVLREFQREGTFLIRRSGDSSLEVQGVIVRADTHSVRYDRSYGSRASEFRYRVTAEISLVNKDTGKVLMDRRQFSASTTFLVQGDRLTGQRNAAQRISQELAQQIVDAVVSYPYEGDEDRKETK